MNRILIVKTGTTFATLKAIRGDFDAWVMNGFGRDRRVVADVVDVARGAVLPSPSEYSGVIVTGSHQMVTDHADWSERTAEWLAQAVRMEVPTLGVCYGHQLLAYAFGGKVGDNPNGLEVGTVVVMPNAFGTQDALLSGFQGPFKAHMCHRQSVLALPKGAVPLATTRKEGCAAFSLHEVAWGVQFHPEFDCWIEKAYVARCGEELASQGEDVQGVLSNCMETGSGHEIFRRFLAVVDERVKLVC